MLNKPVAVTLSREDSHLTESERNDTLRPDFSPVQRYMLIAAYVVAAIRTILRTVFVIIATTATGIPLMVVSLLSIALLI